MNAIIPLKPTVLYDGQCPLCAREIRHYMKLDGHEQLEWVDLHAAPERLDRYGITREQAMAELHVVIPGNEGGWTTARGVDGFYAIWTRLTGYRWLWRIVSFGPLDRLARFAYSRFARWRYARRTAGTCSASTGRCASAQASRSLSAHNPPTEQSR